MFVPSPELVWKCLQRHTVCVRRAPPSWLWYRSVRQTVTSHEWGHLSPLPQSQCVSVNRANWLIVFATNKPQRQRDIQQVACRDYGRTDSPWEFDEFTVFLSQNLSPLSRLFFLDILCWACWDQTDTSWILRSWSCRMTTATVTMQQSLRKRCETLSLRVSGQILSLPWESSIRYSMMHREDLMPYKHYSC